MADLSVRPARLGDVESMATIQLTSWRSTQGLPGGDEAVPDRDVVTRAWERAVMVPPSAGHTVWVATAADEVVGLAAVAPASDPDLDDAVTSELLLLAIDPLHRGHGHGSRLLAATMDSLIETGHATAVTWVTAQDDESRRFLEKAGWGVDGAHRSLAQHADDPPAARLRQLRMGTDLSPADSTGQR